MKLPLPALAFSFGTALRSHAADPNPQRYDLSKRSSEMDSLTPKHLEIEFVFKDARGTVIDLEYATTAARFAIDQKVDRTVMFSGHRDNTENWQGLHSATPSNRFFGFSHALDGGWVGDHYCRSWQLLGMHQHGPIVNVDESVTPYRKSGSQMEQRK